MNNQYDRSISSEHFNPALSHEKILMQVPPGSKVLECGCATGYMTRYMRDELGCEVSIIEYDAEAYTVARQYASDGICADLMQTEWLEKFRGKKFDYILFADVLEHLYDPQTVLKYAASLLKVNGHILISVPNVAHGDILMNLWSGNWNYTETGLLDKTHIRFFAENSLESFLKGAGLSMVHLDYTTLPVGQTEQAAYKYNQSEIFNTELNLLSALAEKKVFSVYQFIINAQLTEYVEHYHIKREKVQSILPMATLYYSQGGDFSEELARKVPYAAPEFHQHFEWRTVHPKALRFDPVERQACMITSIKVISNEGELEIFPANGYRFGNMDIFTTSDSQYAITIGTKNIEWIEISAHIELFSNNIVWSGLSQLVQNCVELKEEKSFQGRVEQGLKAEIQGLQQVNRELEQELQQANQESEKLQQVNRELGQELQQASQESEKLQQVNRELGQKLRQANQETEKLQQINWELDEEHQQANQEVEKLQKRCEELCGQLVQTKYAYEVISNAFFWKITKPMRVITDILKSFTVENSFMRKARKAVSIWRHRGWKELCLAMKRHSKKMKEIKENGRLFQGQMSLNNKDGYLPYDSEFQLNIDFSKGQDPDVKMIAFYLPQFHAFPENDEWWGEGFTEWVNVRNGAPQFEGHYQPRVPHPDIGYYCLNDISVIHHQALLAKQHGIYGFCFYYYWFSGKRLMEKPVDMLLEHHEIDIPFCLCWANENWTRTWDGLDKNILIQQNYSDEDDENFMIDLKKYLDDERYIRINGKPLILVYNPGQIPNPHKSFEKWRNCARKIGVGEILIWTCQTANNTAKLLNIEKYVDAEVEFPPHNMWVESIGVHDLDTGGKEAYIYNYQCLVKYMEDKLSKPTDTPVPVHRSCMLAWDNQARRKEGWFTFYAFSLKSLYCWVLSIVDRTRKDFDPEERYAFVNAWNEWGEGTYLEPDEMYGYANINTVSKALYGVPFYSDLKILYLFSRVQDQRWADTIQGL